MTVQNQHRVTLDELRRVSGLARSSLLHYEALGLLIPAARSASGYRLYGEAEIERLRTIRRYREAGLSLAAIRDLLSTGRSAGTSPAARLEARLLELCREVEGLRAQQRLLARLLSAPELRAELGGCDKAGWVALLRRAGFDEEEMRRWHRGFEAAAPDDHEAFLVSLGLAPADVATIRRGSH